MDSTVLKVNGMKCSNCVDIIRSSVGAIKGVENVEIDPDTKKVKVYFDGSMVKEQQIKDTILDMGYGIDNNKAD